MKNIHRIALPTQFGMETVNSFLIKGDEVVLIDCGEDTDASFEALKLGLGNQGILLQDIDRIILTHAHVDHMGMAERVAKASGAEVWVSELCENWALDPEQMWSSREELMVPSLMSYFEKSMRPLISNGYEQMMGNVKKVWHPVNKERIVIYKSEGSLEINGERWETIYMPGHTQTQSTFLHISSGTYLSADMLLRITTTPVIEPSITDSTRRNKGIIQMMKSYERLKRYDIKNVLPGHYDIFNNANEVIEAQVARIYARAEECLGLVKSGHYSFINLFNELYKGRFHMPALIMLIGYLDLLEERGDIKLVEREGFSHIIPV